MKGMFPLDVMKALAEGAEEVENAANGFGMLLECVIRVEPEREGESSYILRYGIEPAVSGNALIWTFEFVPPEGVAVTRCADCGVEIELKLGGWATAGTAGTARVWGMTCRDVIEGDRLVSADYHHVAGETQRHWPPREEV